MSEDPNVTSPLIASSHPESYNANRGGESVIDFVGNVQGSEIRRARNGGNGSSVAASKAKKKKKKKRRKTKEFF